MNSRWIKSVVSAATVVMIAGCGGGGGGSGGAFFPVAATPAPAPAPAPSPAPAPAPAPAATLSGIVATGSAAAGASVTATCAVGTALTGTTDASGAFSLTLENQSFPCLVSASGGSLPSGQTLHSIALNSDGRINVTPLTDLIVANAAGAVPDQLPVGSVSELEARLAAARANVYASLAASGYPATDALADPLTGEFAPQAGDPHDDLLEVLATSLADASKTHADLVAQVAAAGDAPVPIPRSYVMTTADVSAQPQLNKGSLEVAGGQLSMKLGAGANAVGAYVGGGTGNKAVLQLPGLTGMKLKDFVDMSLELKGDDTGTGIGISKPYVYVNLVVDLQCDASPLPADATIDQVRARRRFLIYDPFYKFIQQDNAIGSVDFSTITFSRATGGWRGSAGSSLGTGVALGSSSYSGLETLDGFDFQTYPDACIAEGITADGGLFRDKTADPACDTTLGLPGSAPAICGKPHGGALVVLGDSGSVLASDWKLKTVHLNGFNARTWRFE